MDTRSALSDFEATAARWGVCPVDVLLIAANMHGASSALGLPRARMQLKPIGQSETWQVILPLTVDDSPFSLGGGLFISERKVADLVAIENDDVVLTYIRAAGRSLTLNTYSRSACTGCVFCPNIIEDAADGTINGARDLEQLLVWVCADNNWPDLSSVNIITVCSGCFRTPPAAIRHLTDLRAAAEQLKFSGCIHLLSSVVRDKDDIRTLAEEAGPFHLTLTFECFTRREVLLKSTKASLTFDQCCRILDDCAQNGVLGDFTYIAGIDPLDVAVRGLIQLAEHASTFPRIQIFQAHNDYMRAYRDPAAGDVEYFLRLREEIEPFFAQQELRPRSWENYRPLWYTRFANRPVEGPRV